MYLETWKILKSNSRLIKAFEECMGTPFNVTKTWSCTITFHTFLTIPALLHTWLKKLFSLVSGLQHANVFHPRISLLFMPPSFFLSSKGTFYLSQDKASAWWKHPTLGCLSASAFSSQTQPRSSPTASTQGNRSAANNGCHRYQMYRSKHILSKKHIYTSKYVRPAGFPYLDVENIKGHKDK